MNKTPLYVTINEAFEAAGGFGAAAAVVVALFFYSLSLALSLALCLSNDCVCRALFFVFFSLSNQ